MYHTIYKLVDKKVSAPSEDFYARSGDTQEAEIQNLEFIESYDEFEECVQHLEELKKDTESEYKYKKGAYLIIPTFVI